MPEAVLFDVDGVLIDSAAMHRGTWGAWADLRAIDHAVMFEGIHGERGIETMRRVAPHLDPLGELEMLGQILLEHEEKSIAYPEARELLTRYAGRCGLVTSGPREGTLARFARLDLPVPAVTVFGDDVSAGKPDPEPYALGAKRLGLAPAACVVVEDAPAGIASGRAAGCYVIGVTTSVTAAECAGADEVVTDLGAVARRLAELVPVDPVS